MFEMDEVLKRLGLQNLTVNFANEKITPDLVCKLSKYEMLSLGVSSSSDAMKLRIECLKFGCLAPASTQSSSFKKEYEISKELLENLIGSGFTVSNMAKMLSVSERTLYRRMGKYGIQSKTVTDIDDNSLDAVLGEILIEFPRCGEKMLRQLLLTKGIMLRRSTLRCALSRIDSEGIEQRKKRRLHRRIYSVAAPNHLWHIDTNHKLIRWNFIIAGGVDGFSRFVVFLKCVDNNRADTIYSCFHSGVEVYGTPLRVRSDQGLENLKVADYMLAHRSNSSMIVGKSTHNQRIERMWRDIFDGVLSFFYDLFYFLEEHSLLYPLNNAHIFALHYVYMPKINCNLSMWQESWNTHKIRTVGASPLFLFTAGSLSTPTPPEDMEDFGEDTDYRTEQQGDTRPNLPSVSYEISERCQDHLMAECPRNWESQTLGIDVYERALRIITSESNYQ